MPDLAAVIREIEKSSLHEVFCASCGDDPWPCDCKAPKLIDQLRHALSSAVDRDSVLEPTEEMLDAGVRLYEYWMGNPHQKEIVRVIYKTMRREELKTKPEGGA